MTRCKFGEQVCRSYPTYKRVNPTSQLTFVGECIQADCSSFLYAYSVYFTLNKNLTSSANNDWQSVNSVNDNLLIGKTPFFPDHV